MMLLDLLFDIYFAIYTSLGFGTKEFKVESKMEKIGKQYPIAYQIYCHNKNVFETDTLLSEKIILLNLKCVAEVEAFVQEIQLKYAIGNNKFITRTT